MPHARTHRRAVQAAIAGCCTYPIHAPTHLDRSPATSSQSECCMKTGHFARPLAGDRSHKSPGNRQNRVVAKDPPCHLSVAIKYRQIEAHSAAADKDMIFRCKNPSGHSSNCNGLAHTESISHPFPLAMNAIRRISYVSRSRRHTFISDGDPSMKASGKTPRIRFSLCLHTKPQTTKFTIRPHKSSSSTPLPPRAFLYQHPPGRNREFMLSHPHHWPR